MKREDYAKQIANMATTLLSRTDHIIDRDGIEWAIETAAEIFVAATLQAQYEFMDGEDTTDVLDEKTF